MKFRRICLALLFAGILSNASAQSKGRRIYFGVLFAPQIGILSTATNSHYSLYKTGLEFKVRLTGRLALSTGLLVDNRRYTISEILYSSKEFYSALQVPLRLDIRFSRKRTSFFITGGAMFNLAEYGNSSVTFTNPNTPSVNNGGDLQGIFTTGLLCGAGLDVSVAGFKMQAYPYFEATLSDLRYYKLGFALSLFIGKIRL